VLTLTIGAAAVTAAAIMVTGAMEAGAGTAIGATGKEAAGLDTDIDGAVAAAVAIWGGGARHGSVH